MRSPRELQLRREALRLCLCIAKLEAELGGISKLTRVGKVRRPKDDLYAALTPQQARRLTPSAKEAASAKTLTRRLDRAVNDATAPLSLTQLLAHLKLPATQRRTVRRTLDELVGAGRVQRMPGARFGGKADTPARPRTPRAESLLRRLERVVHEAKAPLPLAEIIACVGVTASQEKSAAALLGKLVREGTLRRVRPSVFVANASVARTRPRTTFTSEVSRVVVEAKGEVTIAGIVATLELPASQRPMVRAGLSRLVEDGRLRRVRGGVYAPPLPPESRATTTRPETTPPSLERALFDALAKHAGGVPLETVAPMLEGDDEDIDQALRALLASKRARRVRRGIYVAVGK